MSIEQKRNKVDPADPEFSVATQCKMLDLPRSSYYYRASELDPATIETMRAIDEEYTRHPFYGKRTMARYLGEQGYKIGVKRTRTLMSIMGLVSVAPGPNTSCPHPEHKKYPYLLRNLAITRPNQVWAIDITYIRLSHGHVYLTAIIDWFSRYVISWRLSPTLDSEFCVRCAEEAFDRSGCPEIFNSDQGVQFTCREFIKELEKRSVTISMDSKGRAFDNIMIERLWRTIKYEEVYLKEYTGIVDCRNNLEQYIRFYNTSRYHSAIGGTPYDVYSQKF